MANKSAALGFIFVTLLIDVIGFGIIIPVVPNLISELGHVSIPEAASYGGWLIAAFSLMQFVFSPVLGNLSDQYGRRPILLISLFVLALIICSRRSPQRSLGYLQVVSSQESWVLVLLQPQRI